MFAALLKEITINRSVLRQFAWIMSIMLIVVIPLIISWFHDWQIVIPARIVAGIGLLFLIAGLVAPHWLRHVYIGWMLIALILRTVVTGIIITIVFYTLITPIGFIRRQFGSRDLLGLRPDPKKKSYWVIREQPSSPGQMKKQY